MAAPDPALLTCIVSNSYIYLIEHEDRSLSNTRGANKYIYTPGYTTYGILNCMGLSE